ncbi:nuclear transport factor 2 family protein [Pseudonocardia sp. WMMC193]|uniref:nuclear transport factor 2 family protein n=1 Tax=Pseudonocardia sp. WMMC193 TaxID=2911965 RepID=UPI001F47F2F1|nr:nuclear transport factor 2 family protein [Pseudonocardia sp. WMMC193]MCF7549371.1 nuclear transport factor 2 family protein [Pseudonocardia sp. WMMC193]
MATIEELMRANLLDVFNERDPARRAEAIARTYATDVSFADPEETVTGFDALAAKAQKILDEAPGFVFSPGGPIRVVQDLGFLEWRFGPEGQPPVVTGADVALVQDGRIVKVWTMLLSGA